MLNIWRQKVQWLCEGANNTHGRIIDFWNGSNFQEVKDFWVPMASYELPAVCSNAACKKIYATFPISKHHEALERGWDGDKGVYDLTCSECLEDIQCIKKFQRGDPRNVALLLHWDGFQTSRRTQKSCGVVEVLLLNAGPNSFVEVLPVLVITQSCKKSIKGSGDVFALCLMPLVEELEKLFLDGEEVIYEYPLEKIFDNSEGYAKSCKIRAMLMTIIDDHPAECKIGMFKNGGSKFCRGDKAQATLVKDSLKPDGWYVYDENRYQARFPPPSRTIDEMKAALEDAKRCCTQGEKEAACKKADDIRVAKLLLQSWRVRMEEYIGANFSPLEHVAGNGELLDDVIHHGLHDRYWSYIFERLVKIYNTIKTNNMQDEASFVQFYLRKFFTKVFQVVLSDCDGLLLECRFLRTLHASMSGIANVSTTEGFLEECHVKHMEGLAIVSFVGAAKSLWDAMLKYGQRAPCIDSLLLKGIAVSKKGCVYREPTSEESMFLRSFLNIEENIPITKVNIEENIPITEVKTFNKVLFRGEIYKVGSEVVVKIDNAQNDNDLSKLIDTDTVMVSSKDKKEEASTHIDNAQNDNDLSKLIGMDVVMVSSKDKEEEASTHEDVEVYIPKIPWQNNGDTNDAYEEYQKFLSDESFGVALKEKGSYATPHDDDLIHVKNKEIKDITLSELCDATLDLISRKSAQKRKATSKLQVLLKSKDKNFKMSKVKKKKEHPREPREDSVNDESLSLERKARDLCLGDK
ncbi:hypothetical protein L7F22_037309 [Adiantum nelumboides]|nr:hypothetical protein [Adiantum nelumboides]